MQFLPQNAIIIDEDVFVLVEDDEPDECLRCALHDKCDTQNLLCQILTDAPTDLRFERIERTDSPWHTIIDGEGVPDNDEVVIGYWISGPEKFAEACWYDKEHGKWYSGQTGDELHEPDYWVMKPENYAKDGCL
jgi:hypothetical protein